MEEEGEVDVFGNPLLHTLLHQHTDERAGPGRLLDNSIPNVDFGRSTHIPTASLRKADEDVTANDSGSEDGLRTLATGTTTGRSRTWR